MVGHGHGHGHGYTQVDDHKEYRERAMVGEHPEDGHDLTILHRVKFILYIDTLTRQGLSV
jgi:hypothetical protein